MRKAMLWVLLGAALAACARQQARTTSGAPAETARPAVAQAPAPVASPAPQPGAVYVDVRTPAEFAAGHVTGALNIPYDQMPQRWQELDSLRAKPVVLYCRSGHRAGIALEELKTHGFTSVVNGGGLE
ncbi:MAG TPA: rhodanese-like domain-containing protein, partial [Longimicrobiales bacterium]